VAIRTFIEPSALAAAVRREVKRLDQELPAFDMATMEERMARQTAPRRFELALIGLYGVSPQDGATFGLATAVILLVALVASWLPARRAARLDPVQILRTD
jgi:hypothetical protein